MDLWDQITDALSRKSPVQLVKNYHEVPDSVKTKQMLWPAIAQKKEDGVYCMIVKHAGTTMWFSRTGKLYYTEVAKRWEAFSFQLPDGCWIAELINPAMSLETLSGLVNPNRVEPWKDYQKEAMRLSSEFKFHDHVSIEALLSAKDVRPYTDRFYQVIHYVPQRNVVHYQWVYNETEWQAYIDTQIALDFEGAVLKQASAHWVAGHKGWRVTKAVRGLDVDLVCTGVILGTGKFDGLIAGLTFEWKGKQFTAGLGKGWDLEYQKVQTMAWIQDEFNVVGQIWRVTALQESSKGVLRLPKVGEMRMDKNVAD